MSESLPEKRILEVGPGNLPAAILPGSLFDEATRYIGIEPGLELAAKSQAALSADAKNLAGPLPNHTIIPGDGGTAPFAANAFSHAIMKNVYGEYTALDHRETGSTLHNTRLTAYRIFEALQVGGVVAIAEEQAPYGPGSVWRVASGLELAGFVDIRAFPCQDMKNSNWDTERAHYWSTGEPIEPRWAYLLTATKPDVPTKVFWEPVTLNAILRGRFKDPRERLDWRLPAQFIRARGSDRRNKDRFDWQKAVTVVTDNEHFTLDQHQIRKTKGGQDLFLT